MLKVVHYINQFFANIGGEEKADYPVEVREAEVIGPGLASVSYTHLDVYKRQVRGHVIAV